MRDTKWHSLSQSDPAGCSAINNGCCNLVPPSKQVTPVCIVRTEISEGNRGRGGGIEEREREREKWRHGGRNEERKEREGRKAV